MENVFRQTICMVDTFMTYVEHASPHKQILLGALTGCIFGLILPRFGRSILQTLGGGLIFFEFLTQIGYISCTPWIFHVIEFIDKYVVFTSSFTGGFLIGLS